MIRGRTLSKTSPPQITSRVAILLFVAMLIVVTMAAVMHTTVVGVQRDSGAVVGSSSSPFTFASALEIDPIEKPNKAQHNEEEDDGPSLKSGVFGSRKAAQRKVKVSMDSQQQPDATKTSPPASTTPTPPQTEETTSTQQQQEQQQYAYIGINEVGGGGDNNVEDAAVVKSSNIINNNNDDDGGININVRSPPVVELSEGELQEYLLEEVKRRHEGTPAAPPLTAGEHARTEAGDPTRDPAAGDDQLVTPSTAPTTTTTESRKSIPSTTNVKRRDEYFQAAEDAVRMALTKTTTTGSSSTGKASSQPSPLTPTSIRASRTLSTKGKAAHFSEAVRNYQAAARRGHPLAMNRLAILHAHGLGVAKSEAKAVLFHKFASFGGSVESSIALSHRHENGIGVRPSTKAAAVYALMASKLVSTSYHIDLKAEQHQVRLADESKGLKMSSIPNSKTVGGKRYIDTRGKILAADDVLQMFQVEADRGSPTALMFLGYAYLHGDSGVRRDAHRALQFFRDALQDHSHAAAYGALGQIYVQGVLTADPPIQPDPRKALKYFMDGSKLSDPSSLNGLGYFYAKAAAAAGARDAVASFGLQDDNDLNNNVLRPTPQSLYEKAYQCFSDASSHSNADALYNMAILTKYGYGTPKDNVRSMSFLRRASAGGSVLARHHLGVHRTRSSQAEENHLQALSDFKEVLTKGPWNRRLVRAYDAYHAGDYQTALLQYLMAAEIGDKLGSSNSLFMLQRSSTMGPQQGTYGLGTEGIPLYRYEYHPQPPPATTTTPTTSSAATVAFSPTFLGDQAAAAENFVVGLTLRLAKEGDKDAQLFLGDYYFYTSTPERDLLKKSLEHYRTAAEGDFGLAQANFNVGYMCQRGFGTPTDYHLAKRYYDRSLQLSTSDTAGDAYYAVNAALMSLNFQYWFDYFFDLAKKEDFTAEVGPSLTRRAPAVTPEDETRGDMMSSIADFRVWLIRVGRLAPKILGYPLDDVCLFSALVAIGGLLALRNHIALN